MIPQLIEPLLIFFLTEVDMIPQVIEPLLPMSQCKLPNQSINIIVLLLLFLPKVGIMPQALRNYPMVCHQSGVSGSRPRCIVQKCPICIFYLYYYYYYYCYYYYYYFI